MGKTFKDKKAKFQKNDADYLKPKQKYKKTKQYLQHINDEEEELQIKQTVIENEVVEDDSEVENNN